MLTIKEVANRYGVTEWTIRDWIRRGKLRAVRLGHRTVRIEASELEDFERRRKS